MTELKAVTATEKKVNRILSDRKAEEKDVNGQIQKAVTAIEAANDAMTAATASGDFDAYLRAKSERQTAADQKEMYTSRLDTLKNKALISTEEYNRLVKDIYAEIAALDNATRQRLAELAEGMEEAANALQEAVIKANNALHHLQHDVYRDADRKRNPKTGDFYPFEGDEKTVDKAATISWGKCAVYHRQYKEYTGRNVG